MIQKVSSPLVSKHRNQGHTRGDGRHSRISVRRPVIDRIARAVERFNRPAWNIQKADMSFLKSLSVLCLMGTASAATAQEVPDALVEILTEQGYEITSTRYTWLGRIYVEASDGTHERSILIGRATGHILQDNLISAGQTSSSRPNQADETKEAPDPSTKVPTPSPEITKDDDANTKRPTPPREDGARDRPAPPDSPDKGKPS